MLDLTARTVVAPDGTRLGWETTGDGPPVLLVHGGTADRGRWAATTPFLARHFGVHAIDRRGRGASTREAPGAYSLAREGQDLLACAEAIGGTIDVIAHSYGVLCALEAVAAGATFRRLLLYEPPLRGVVSPAAAQRVTADLEDAPDRALCTFLSEIAGLGAHQIAAMRRSEQWTPRLAALKTFPREAAAAARYTPPVEQLALAGLATVLVGERTTPPLAAAARALHAALPRAELHVIAGAGHCAMDEDPAAFASLVVELLD